MRRLIIFITLVIQSNLVFANSNDNFMLGIKNYQQNNYPAAIEEFNKALVQEPQNSIIITNLGLAYFKSGKNYLALAYLRKAHRLSPWLDTPVAAIEFITAKTQIRPLPGEVSSYQNLRALSKQFPLPLVAFVSCVSLLIFALTLIQYLSKRKKSEQEETAPPSAPWFSVVFGFISLGLIMLSCLMFYDDQLIYGTVVEDKTSLRIAPDEEQIELSELYGGLEVEVGQTVDSWVQVTYGGTLTGWVKKGAIFY